MTERQERAEAIYNLAYDLLSSDNYSPSDEQVQAHVLRIETGLRSIPTNRLSEMLSRAIIEKAPKAPTVGDIATARRIEQSKGAGNTTQATEPDFEADRSGPGATAAKLQMLRFARGMGMVVCSCKTRHVDKLGNEHFYTVTATLSKDKQRWVCAGPDRKAPLRDEPACYFALPVSEQEKNMLAQDGGKSLLEAIVPAPGIETSQEKAPDVVVKAPAVFEKMNAHEKPVPVSFDLFLMKCGYDPEVLKPDEMATLRPFYDWTQVQMPPIKVTRNTFEECWNDWRAAVEMGAAA